MRQATNFCYMYVDQDTKEGGCQECVAETDTFLAPLLYPSIKGVSFLLDHFSP